MNAVLLRGAHNRIAPEDWLRSLTERVPDQARDGAVLRRWVSLAAGAHMVPFTHGELVAGGIREFLAELGDRSSEAGSGR